MKNSYSYIDPKGNVIWDGPLTLCKGNHKNMPSRDANYLSTDERFHVNASSLGGDNTISNIVAGDADVNHGGYFQMELGSRREVLKAGGAIQSEKIAFVNGSPGDRPSCFLVNDSISYPDGHTEAIHLSFLNESYAYQDMWNSKTASMPDAFDDAPNPGDTLRESMSASEYADLMQETDAFLPSIREMYAPCEAAEPALPGSASPSDTATTNSDVSPAAATDAIISATAECDTDL